jgi:cell division protein FtsB
MRIYKFDVVVSFTCASLLGFFAWHAFHGQRGFEYRDRLQLQAAQLTDELAEIQKQRTGTERRVALLRPESVDTDMLDEMARKTLDVGQSNELIVVETP